MEISVPMEKNQQRQSKSHYKSKKSLNTNPQGRQSQRLQFRLLLKIKKTYRVHEKKRTIRSPVPENGGNKDKREKKSQECFLEPHKKATWNRNTKTGDRQLPTPNPLPQ
jgi:hypothetical protein